MSSRGREVRSEAIVLRSRTLREDDLLVDFLTPNEGRLWGVARHGRKSQKRFGTVLEALNIIHIRYRDAGGFVFLEEASLAVPLSRLSRNISQLMGGFYVSDLLREYVPERSPDSELYDHAREVLISLNADDPWRRVIANFESRLLDRSGFSPRLDACLYCLRKRRENEGEKFYFVFREGGIVCGVCLPGGVDFDVFSEKALPRILSRFIEYQLGHPLKSGKFLTQAGFFE